MKRWMAMVLTFALTLGLLGGLGVELKAEETKTLVIAARGGSHVDAINAVKGEFEEANNVIIEVAGYESADLKQQIQLDSIKAEGGIDLVMLDDPWMPEMTEAGVLLNLTEAGLEPDEDFVKTSTDVGRVPYAEGDLYAMPFSGNVMLFFYNSDLVAELPTSWTQVLEVAEGLKAEDSLGYVIRGQQGNPIVSDWLPIFWAHGGEVFNEEWEAQVNSEAGIASLELYLKLLESGANYEKNDLVAAVTEGQAGMSLGWPSWYVSGEEASAAYGVIPSQVDADSDVNPSGMIGNWMMGVTANSTNPEIAVQFLEFITSEDAQKAGALVGGVPTRKAVLTDEELVAQYPYFPTIMEGMELGVVRPRHSKWSAAEEALGSELSAAVVGTKTVQEALDAAVNSMNAAIAN